jgi:hypothetical protein
MRGWKRIGIVLSVVWVFVGGFWGRNIGIHEGDFATALYDICLRMDNSDWTKCGADFKNYYERDIQNPWLYAAILAFVPIPIAWLIVWGCVAVGRWIHRGFAKSI